MSSTKYLRPTAAAEFVQLSSSTLAKMRMRGDGPPFIKSGTKRVLYKLVDLEEWLEARTHQSTSEY